MRRVAATVLLDDQQDGVAARLWLERVEDGVGTIFPAPDRMAFLRYDAAFAQSIQTAWNAIQRPDDADVRWWLDNLRGRDGAPESLHHILAGPSLGAAFAVGLLHALSAGSPDLDETWAIVGAINPDGSLGSVGGYERKLEIAWHLGLRVIVPKDDYPRVVGEWGHRLKEMKSAATYAQASNLARTWHSPVRTGQRARELERQQRLMITSAELIFSGGRLDAVQGRTHVDIVRSRLNEQDRLTVQDRQLEVLANVLYGWSFAEVGSIPPCSGRNVLEQVRVASVESRELKSVRAYARWSEASQWRKHGDMVEGDLRDRCYVIAKQLLNDLVSSSHTDPYIRALGLTELAKIAIGLGDDVAADSYSHEALALIRVASPPLGFDEELRLPYWIDQAEGHALETRMRTNLMFGVHNDESFGNIESDTEPPVISIAVRMSNAQLKLRNSNNSTWESSLRELWKARIDATQPNGFPRFVRQSVRALRRMVDHSPELGIWLREFGTLASYCPRPSCNKWTQWHYAAGVQDFVCSECGRRLPLASRSYSGLQIP